MRILLKLKHWQLFLFTWGIPIAINLYSFSNPRLMATLFPVMMLVFLIGIFGWIWAISTVLHQKLSPEITLNVQRFKITFSIPILYTLGITVWMAYRFYFGGADENTNLAAVIGVIIFFHIISMVCILLGLRFAARTMKSVELGRLARFSEYAIEFFLIWFSPIGFWLLQPRLNKLAKDI